MSRQSTHTIKLLRELMYNYLENFSRVVKFGTLPLSYLLHFQCAIDKKRQKTKT